MDTKDLQQIFTYHPPNEEQQKKYRQLRLAALNFAILINELCPESREKSLAITSVQKATMMANSAIAIHDENSQ